MATMRDQTTVCAQCGAELTDTNRLNVNECATGECGAPLRPDICVHCRDKNKKLSYAVSYGMMIFAGLIALSLVSMVFFELAAS